MWHPCSYTIFIKMKEPVHVLFVVEIYLCWMFKPYNPFKCRLDHFWNEITSLIYWKYFHWLLPTYTLSQSLPKKNFYNFVLNTKTDSILLRGYCVVVRYLNAKLRQQKDVYIITLSYFTCIMFVFYRGTMKYISNDPSKNFN